jgi:predicted GH43/DUF377 family glycosyl hydrolase
MGDKGIIIDLVDNLEFNGNRFLNGESCIITRDSEWDSQKIGISATPIKTNKGWLLLYHGVSKFDHKYRVGTILLDSNNPFKILRRSKYPILEPETQYEKNGIVNNVVFPCGAVVFEDKVMVYYGAADKAIGVAAINVNDILS